MVNFKPRAEKLRRERIRQEIQRHLESMARVAGDSARRNIEKALASKDEDEFVYYCTTAKMDARDAFTYAAMSYGQLMLHPDPPKVE